MRANEKAALLEQERPNKKEAKEKVSRSERIVKACAWGFALSVIVLIGGIGASEIESVGLLTGVTISLLGAVGMAVCAFILNIVKEDVR